MTDDIKELLNLIKANPDLPIVPIVDCEIGGDEWRYWVAKWGSASVDEYCDKGNKYGEERILLRAQDDDVDIFEQHFDYEECGITDDMSDEEIDNAPTIIEADKAESEVSE